MNESIIDRPKAVRKGEEIDPAHLEAYIRSVVTDSNDPISISQFPSGFSNLTYLIAVGEKEYILRRPPFGNEEKSAHDMGREHKILSKIHAVYPPAPHPIDFCNDLSILGCPFYVMERIKGVILRQSLPRDLELPPATVEKLCRSIIDNFVALHSVDYVKAGLGDLGKPEGYVERQISGWTRRYHNAQTDDIPAVLEVADWLAKNMPPESGASLIHNDYKYDNIVLDPHDITRVLGVLDWEMSTIGDPLMDLGTSVGYWIEENDPPAMQAFVVGPTRLPGSFTRKQFIEYYQEKSGRTVSSPLFYFVYGIFKLAVVVQQIYARYKKGHTKDERFAHLNVVVTMLAEGARDYIQKGDI